MRVVKAFMKLAGHGYPLERRGPGRPDEDE